MKDQYDDEFTGRRCISPFVAFIRCVGTVVVLLLWCHSIPFLGLAVVPPSIVKVGKRVLYNLHII